ncbi:hypothetical protein Q672_07045 [Marinobacter sp. EVN1]|nr:hypothetical protein Q672_07045 [Marinobacter sp. EVN1]
MGYSLFDVMKFQVSAVKNNGVPRKLQLVFSFPAMASIPLLTRGKRFAEASFVPVFIVFFHKQFGNSWFGQGKGGVIISVLPKPSPPG